MKFALPIGSVINAQKCTAKNDIRFYLNGFHVTKDGISATNGHYIYHAKLKDFEYPERITENHDIGEMPVSIIIKMKQPIKKPTAKSGCDFVIFDVTDTKVIATTVNQFGGEIGCFLGETIDGRFPDINKVIPSGDEKEDFASISFNADYLKKLSDVSDGRFKAVTMKCYGQKKAVLFEISSSSAHYEPIFVLMPIRI